MPECFFSKFLAGGVCGVAGSLVFGALGATTIGPQGGEDPGLIGTFIGALAGSMIGSSLGVYVIGKIGDERGSYGATLLGSAAGLLTLLLIPSDPDDLLFWIRLYASPTLGGILAFNLSRENKDQQEADRASIHFKEDRMALAIHGNGFQASNAERGIFIPKMNIIQVHF